MKTGADLSQPLVLAFNDRLYKALADVENAQGAMRDVQLAGLLGVVVAQMAESIGPLGTVAILDVQVAMVKRWGT